MVIAYKARLQSCIYKLLGEVPGSYELSRVQGNYELLQMLGIYEIF